MDRGHWTLDAGRWTDNPVVLTEYLLRSTHSLRFWQLAMLLRQSRRLHEALPLVTYPSYLLLLQASPAPFHGIPCPRWIPTDTLGASRPRFRWEDDDRTLPSPHPNLETGIHAATENLALARHVCKGSPPMLTEPRNTAATNPLRGLVPSSLRNQLPLPTAGYGSNVVFSECRVAAIDTACGVVDTIQARGTHTHEGKLTWTPHLGF